MAVTYQKTKDYKKTKYSWTGNIPSDWKVEKIKAYFYFSKERASDKENDILSLTQKGIKVRDISGNEGQLAATYENYSKLRKGDIVLNPMDLVSGWVSDSDIEGIISPAYRILRLKKGKELDIKFVSKYLQWHWLFEIFFPFGQGVSVDHRWTLGNDTLMNFPILIPPLNTQERIVNFLEDKFEIINTVIEKKQKLIELLKEQREAVIIKTVTKGLDPKVKMRNSNIEWVGNIPLGWTPGMRAKFLFRNLKEINKNMSCDNVLSLTMRGVISRSELGEGGLLPSDYSTFQIFYPNDLVFKLIDLENYRTSRVGIVHEKGIMSSAYIRIISNQKNDIVNKYFYYFYYNLYLQGIFNFIGMGVRSTMNAADLLEMKVIIPPAEIQKQIVNFLDEKIKRIDTAIRTTEDQIKKTKEYRASLIYNVVTGKIII